MISFHGLAWSMKALKSDDLDKPLQCIEMYIKTHLMEEKANCSVMNALRLISREYGGNITKFN